MLSKLVVLNIGDSLPWHGEYVNIGDDARRVGLGYDVHGVAGCSDVNPCRPGVHNLPLFDVFPRVHPFPHINVRTVESVERVNNHLSNRSAFRQLHTVGTVQRRRMGIVIEHPVYGFKGAAVRPLSTYNRQAIPTPQTRQPLWIFA